MPTAHDLVPPQRRLALAVRTRAPGRLAETFASYAGIFYDRAAFDRLACEAAALYAAAGEPRAATFRERLDRRLRERDRPPVAWQPTAAGNAR